MRKKTIMANIQQAELLALKAHKARKTELEALAKAAVQAGRDLIEAQATFTYALEVCGLQTVGASALSEAGEDIVEQIPFLAEGLAEGADEGDAGEDEAEGEPDIEVETIEIAHGTDGDALDPTIFPTLEEMKRTLPPPVNTPAANRARIEKMRAQEKRGSHKSA